MTTIIKNTDVMPLLTGRTPTKINRLLSYFLKEAQVPLSREQWSVMAVLWKNDGCTQQSLADATNRERAGITRLIDHLQKEKLLVRQQHQTDRRTNLVFLTQKGKSLENPVIESLNKTIEVITRGIDKKQIHNVRQTFEQINKNIEKLDLIKK